MEGGRRGKGGPPEVFAMVQDDSKLGIWRKKET